MWLEGGDSKHCLEHRVDRVLARILDFLYLTRKKVVSYYHSTYTEYKQNEV
jgi:hypothetical protein